MAKLPKYTLTYNDKKDRWDLEQDRTNKVVKSFENKADATAGGALPKVLGKEGGSVKIQKMDGKFQEERTFPRAADPKDSKG
ncbi:hypothetical protein C7U89_01485 [Bradyrhizobium sp. WBOS4]|nr:hypothetical protein [Bradyrhizobium sp. WBOS8]MDD1581628.1 hypothetical protein [Bradyrhizobium sp. WBOS4]UUO49899.1 hypothetical protein DCM78_25110 [Bradyrhizobium sp. WBOS04]UUO58666.1 hypothetical protein DCM80_05390 [Bradyrhizobium sp. WBOS08]